MEAGVGTYLDLSFYLLGISISEIGAVSYRHSRGHPGNLADEVATMISSAAAILEVGVFVPKI